MHNENNTHKECARNVTAPRSSRHMHNKICRSKKITSLPVTTPRPPKPAPVFRVSSHNVVVGLIFVLSALFAFGTGTASALAQTLEPIKAASFVPLIGITSTPKPLALPKGPGYVTYHYAVKNFAARGIFLFSSD